MSIIPRYAHTNIYIALSNSCCDDMLDDKLALRTENTMKCEGVYDILTSQLQLNKAPTFERYIENDNGLIKFLAKANAYPLLGILPNVPSTIVKKCLPQKPAY